MTHDDDVVDKRAIRFEDLLEPFELPAGTGWIYSLAVHPLDGSIAAGSSDGRIRRIIIDTEKP